MLKLIHAFDMDFNSVKNYYDAFDDKIRDLNSYAISCVAFGFEYYFHYIEKYERDLYYLVDDENCDYIIGYGSIEDSVILNYHLDYLNYGNIGYGVRPNERGKGYGTVLLKLLLEKCEELGMKEVCCSCLKDNISSKHVILNNHGIFEKEFFDDNSGKYGLKYWISLKPKIMNKIQRMIRRNITRYSIN